MTLRTVVGAIACLVALGALGAVGSAETPPPKQEARGPITDADVVAAIEKGKKFVLQQAKPDGSFADGDMKGGLSALAFMTLAYMGEHPNRDVISRGLDYLMGVSADTDFHDRQGYAVPIRVMGFSYVYKKLLGDRRRFVAMKAKEDIVRMEMGQADNGGWRYKLAGGSDYDFSVTQWPILAMREAMMAGIEFPPADNNLRKSLQLYLKFQQKSGGWYYEGTGAKPSGSMTAAGLASLFIISDILEPSSGCPCQRGKSPARTSQAERAMDTALEWLGKYFSAKQNPEADGVGKGQDLYWLYCVERVGIAAGYKYFGTHHWYREGVEEVLKKQDPNTGSWGGLDNTCFALLFLYKGRAPILFNKLKFEGTWNAHRRDIANLTHFVEQTKEQQFHWQIVELRAPLEELHDAPILYITPETEPNFTADEKKKLRAFTDTGGTILVEASCGNPGVRKWFIDFAKEVWPEWGVAKLPAEHGVWSALNKMKIKPEILGIDDGVRVCVFYSPDDISCAWQTRALTAKTYLFDWGINLYTYATDGAPLRAKLAGREPEKSDRYKEPVKAGPKTALKIARVRYGGNWEAGANYGGFKPLAAQIKTKSGITLEVTEPTAAPFNTGGAAIGELAADQIAYLAGSRDFTFKPEEKEALKAYLGKGGFLWVEAVGGSTAFDQAFRKAAGEMGWKLTLLPGTHPLRHGRMDPGLGYNLTTGIEFRKSFRADRMGRQYAEFIGLFEGDKMIGVYSPFDIVFSATGLEAFKCRGYKAEDAVAVGTNIAVYLSTRK